MDSDISLAKAARSAEAIASAPANGPSPTTLIQISAQISVSMLRMVSRLRRVSTCSTPLVTTLRAARKPSGTASTAAVSVPSSAIDRVCPSASR